MTSLFPPCHITKHVECQLIAVIAAVGADFFFQSNTPNSNYRLYRCVFKCKNVKLKSLEDISCIALCYVEKDCVNVCVCLMSPCAFLCALCIEVQFLIISFQAELPFFGPNNSGSFLVYRITSCLASNTVSHHSVRSKRLEIHP